MTVIRFNAMQTSLPPRLVAAIAIWLAASIAICQRTSPATITLVASGQKSVQIANVQYDTAVATDVKQPASGHGDLVFNLNGISVRAFPVSFTNLITDSAGLVTGIGLQNLTATLFPNLLGAGTGLDLKQVSIGVTTDPQVTISGSATLTLPLRDSASSTPTFLTVSAQAVSVTVSQASTTVLLKGVKLIGPSGNGIHLPGLFIKPSSAMDATLVFPASHKNTWALHADQLDGVADFPKLSSGPGRQVTVAVKGFDADSTGRFDFVDCTGTASPPLHILPDLAPGFILNVNSVSFTKTGGNLAFTKFDGSLTLPPEFKESTTDNRLSVQSLAVDVTSGGIVASGTGLNGRYKGVVFSVRTFGVDLSTEEALPNPPASYPDAAALHWMGIVATDATIQIPVSTKSGSDFVTFKSPSLVIDGKGPTGVFTVDTPPIKIQGYSFTHPTGSLFFNKGVLKSGEVSGALEINKKAGGVATLNVDLSFDIGKDVTLRGSTNDPISLGPIGLVFKNISGSMVKDQGLTLSGTIGFAANIPSLPDQVKNVTIEFKDLRVDPSGELLLPKEASLSFPNPTTLNFGPVGVEIRAVSIETDGTHPTAFSFSGSGFLKDGMEDVLPVKGEISVDRLRVGVGKDGKTPSFSIGGFKVVGDVAGIASIEASLDYSPDKSTGTGFTQTLAGTANLRLNCFGDAPIGGGLFFFVAPNERAWFVGGNVKIPQILIPPPSPNSAPVLSLLGFAGGIGMNVSIAAGTGLVSKADELSYAPPGANVLPNFLVQLGVLLADPVPGVPGKIWWATGALSFETSPPSIDISARASFFDLSTPDFLSVEDWQKRDRIASAFIDVQFSPLALTLGGDFDLTFPTRSATIIRAFGQGRISADLNRLALHIGDKAFGQQPVTVELGSLLDGIANFKAELGISATLPFPSGVASSSAPNAVVDFHAVADMTFPGISLKAELFANASGSIDQAGIHATGRLDLHGTADFEFFTAEVEAIGNVTFDQGSCNVDATLQLTGPIGTFTTGFKHQLFPTGGK